MSIRVESTSIAPSAGPVEPAVAAKPVGTPSAPAAAAEQTESTASDTEETEAEESDEESEADASVEDAEAKDSEDGKPKKKSGSQRRKERAERAEAEVARLQRLVEDMALKRAGDSKTEPVESKPVTAAGEPDPDNFETHREYVKALTRWEAKQLQEEERQKSQKQTLEAEQAKTVSTFQERKKAFAEKNKDFEETLESLNDIPRTPVFESVILESELGPEILYELAKNPEEAKRIAKLPPIAAALELGKIAAKVATDPSEEKKPEPKRITKALKPIEPVGGRSRSVEKSIYDPDISQAEYERLRTKQRSA